MIETVPIPDKTESVRPQAAPAPVSMLCALGWYDEENNAHPCDKPAPYIWGGQDRMYVMSLCKQHLEDQYSNRRRI